MNPRPSTGSSGPFTAFQLVFARDSNTSASHLLGLTVFSPLIVLIGRDDGNVGEHRQGGLSPASWHHSVSGPDRRRWIRALQEVVLYFVSTLLAVACSMSLSASACNRKRSRKAFSAAVRTAAT